MLNIFFFKVYMQDLNFNRSAQMCDLSTARVIAYILNPSICNFTPWRESSLSHFLHPCHLKIGARYVTSVRRFPGIQSRRPCPFPLKYGSLSAPISAMSTRHNFPLSVTFVGVSAHCIQRTVHFSMFPSCRLQIIAYTFHCLQLIAHCSMYNSH